MCAHKYCLGLGLDPIQLVMACVVVHMNERHPLAICGEATMEPKQSEEDMFNNDVSRAWMT